MKKMNLEDMRQINGGWGILIGAAIGRVVGYGICRLRGYGKLC